MALRRWSWLGGSLAGVALAWIVLLPSRPLPDRTGFMFQVLGVAYDLDRVPFRGVYRSTLRQTLGRLRDEVSRAARMDSLRALVRSGRAVRSADGSLSVLYEPPFTADSARQWLAAAAGELEAYPPAGVAGVPVIIALYTDSVRHRAPNTRLDWGWWSARRFADTTGAAPACFVEENLMVRRRTGDVSDGGARDARRLRRNILDYCALYARYGVAGPGVARWTRFGASAPWWYEGLMPLVRQARRRLPPRELPKIEFMWWASAQNWLLKGCLHGSDSACVRMAGMERLGSRAWPHRYEGYWGPMSRRDLVALLLAHGDARQFAAFWRSPRPVAEALASGYGQPAGSVVAGVVQLAYVAPPSGPGTAPRNVVAAIGWSVAALGLAIATAARRQTER